MRRPLVSEVTSPDAIVTNSKQSAVVSLSTLAYMDLDDVYEISSLEILPDEILFDILVRLDIPELHSLSMVWPPTKSWQG